MIMPYVSTFDRTQMMMCSWDSFVDPKSIARLIDAFVNSLDLTKYGVKEAAVEGRHTPFIHKIDSNRNTLLQLRIHRTRHSNKPEFCVPTRSVWKYTSHGCFQASADKSY